MRTGTGARTAALLAASLALAGCLRVEADVAVGPDDTVDMAVTMLDLSGTVGREDPDCADVVDDLADDDAVPDVDYAIEDITAGGDVGCAVSVEDAPLEEMRAEGMSLTRTGEVYTFTLAGDPGLGEDLRSLPGLETTLAVTFPGPVLDAGGGDVTGSTVTWTDPEALAAGVTATGAAGAGIAPTDAGTGTADEPTGDAPSAERPGSGDMAWLWWVLLAVVLLGVAGAVVRAVSVRR
ncbi:LppM family (lipo)protein [Georgenia sp. AZ-5]|uniref:LppM family (lipo)protein n=1 Tax=Georgenia sp. AZ-5 TaxID=3367526 RepID=UPI0037547C7C